jgi:type I restriction enzyme R subunit
MNEAETRADYIDPALKAAGWGVVEGSRIRREYPITLGRLEGQGRRAKPLTADYLLMVTTFWHPRRYADVGAAIS